MRSLDFRAQWQDGLRWRPLSNLEKTQNAVTTWRSCRNMKENYVNTYLCNTQEGSTQHVSRTYAASGLTGDFRLSLDVDKKYGVVWLVLSFLVFCCDARPRHLVWQRPASITPAIVLGHIMDQLILSTVRVKAKGGQWGYWSGITTNRTEGLWKLLQRSGSLFGAVPAFSRFELHGYYDLSRKLILVVDAWPICYVSQYSAIWSGQISFQNNGLKRKKSCTNLFARLPICGSWSVQSRSFVLVIACWKSAYRGRCTLAIRFERNRTESLTLSSRTSAAQVIFFHVLQMTPLFKCHLPHPLRHCNCTRRDSWETKCLWMVYTYLLGANWFSSHALVTMEDA